MSGGIELENHQLFKLNRLIVGAYECFSFQEFLKLAILQLHEVITYDSGMFFCAISRDCSFFKPYAAGGCMEEYYQKQPFPEREDYLKGKEADGAGEEALVYKALDYSRGEVAVEAEPRSSSVRFICTGAGKNRILIRRISLSCGCSNHISPRCFILFTLFRRQTVLKRTAGICQGKGYVSWMET
jgi:hypothetical protein